METALAIAEKKGVKDIFHIDQGRTSVSSGWNTSILNYQPNGLGRYIQTLDAVNITSVIEVSGQKTSVSTNFVAVGKKQDLRLVEIDYTKNEKEFNKEMEGLTKRQRLAHQANYQTIQTALMGLKRTQVEAKQQIPRRSIKTYKDLSKFIDKTLLSAKGKKDPMIKIRSKYGNEREIHKVFGQERRKDVPLFKFDDYSEAKGDIRAGDVIMIEPIVAVPGSEGFKGTVQVYVTREGPEL